MANHAAKAPKARTTGSSHQGSPIAVPTPIKSSKMPRIRMGVRKRKWPKMPLAKPAYPQSLLHKSVIRKSR